jgi:D-alanyl-D-alanine carboxypeptidase
MNRLASTERVLAEATSTIALLERSLAERDTTLSQTAEALRQEERRNNDFAEEIDELTDTVSVLDKLAKTDKELLQKYSKVYFLNENYRPVRITQIPESYVMVGKKDQYFHASAWRFLKKLLDDAGEDNIDLKVVSAYRSFDEQQELKGQYTQVYGSGANAFSADQGYSEHQLGTTVDLADTTTGGAHDSFANSVAYDWLLKNAYRYGFILSYPQGNAYYIFEPWHWRFVGKDLATDLHQANAHFYDWDQRKIDNYLVSIFD